MFSCWSLIDIRTYLQNEWQELGWKLGIDVAWDVNEGWARVRKQLIAVWDTVRGGGGESRTVVKRAAENFRCHQIYASLDLDLGERSYIFSNK